MSWKLLVALVVAAGAVGVVLLTVQDSPRPPTPVKRLDGDQAPPSKQAGLGSKAPAHASPSPAPTVEPPPAEPAVPAEQPGGESAERPSEPSKQPDELAEAWSRLDAVTEKLREASTDPTRLTPEERRALFVAGTGAYDKALAQTRRAGPEASAELSRRYPEFNRLMRAVAPPR